MNNMKFDIIKFINANKNEPMLAEIVKRLYKYHGTILSVDNEFNEVEWLSDEVEYITLEEALERAVK